MKIFFTRRYYEAVLIVAAIMLLLSSQSCFASNHITTSGNQILNNGKPFVVTGVSFDFTGPKIMLNTYYNTTSTTNPWVNYHLRGYDYYFGLNDPTMGANFSTGNDAISELKSRTAPWGVNTLRFMIDQAALNPADSAYTSYVAEVQSAVARAEAAGFVVDLCMFDERNAKAPVVPFQTDNPETPIDNAATEIAALTVVKLFGNDQGVIIELLNEPFPPEKLTPSWVLWSNGGTVTYPGMTYSGDSFVGINNEIAAMRAGAAGSGYVKSLNAIMVQGLDRSFAGYLYNLVDPLNRLIYSVHPYFTQMAPTTANWDASFGTLSMTLPVTISEWNAYPTDPWCTTATFDAPYQFLDYLEARNIGVMGWAFDQGGTIVVSMNGVPTLWPSKPGITGGVGGILQRYFTSGVVPLP